MESNDPLIMLQHEVARLRDENKDLREEISVLRSSVRALNSLLDIIQQLTPQTNVITFLDDVLASALAVVGATDGSLLLIDEETGELVFAIVHGEARDSLTGHRMPPGQGIAGWVIENRRPQIIGDVRRDQRFSPEVDQMFGFETHSMAAVPLLAGERVVGVIEALNKAGDREFDHEDHDLLIVVAQLASVAIARAEAFEEDPA